MKSARYLSILGTMVIGAALSLSVALVPHSVHAQTVGVSIQNYSFGPRVLAVPPGSTVSWTNHDTVAHTTSSDAGIWDSGVLQPGMSFSHTFNQAGVFVYHCHIHAFMSGVVVVGTLAPPGTLAIAVTPSTVTAGSTAIVHGAGFTPNNTAFVFWRRPDGTTNGSFTATDASGMFSLRLGFTPSHGTGVEPVTGFDRATGRFSPTINVPVLPGAPSTGQLAATINPVSNGGSTAIVGRGFTPGGLVYVQWSRPDGTRAAVWIRVDATGAFSLGFLADSRHGCGSRQFIAFDNTRQMWTAPFILAVRC
jgi:plastocyanin